jgi:hypothetical protein
MGFFKGLRDVQQMGKEHGGMPSVRGSLKDIGKLADDRGEREVLKNGVAAKGIVQGFAEPVPGDRFAMQVPIDVHPPQGKPYRVHYVFATTRMQVALSVGMEVPVKYLPHEPERIAVQWDAQKASISAAGGDMAAVTQGLQATYGQAADQAMREAQAKQRSDDPAERLKKLKQMKDAGLIDSAELEAKKAEIMGSL